MAVHSVKSGYVMNGDLPLHYLEWGDPTAPAIVLVAAIRHSAFEWRYVAERLADKCRVVAVDLRGHGDSGPFPDGEYDPDGYVQDLRTFIQQIGIAPAVVLGFSVVTSGAAIGLAAAYPDLVRGVVMVDGGRGYLKEQAEAAGERVRNLPTHFGSWKEAVDYFATSPDQQFATRETLEERAPYIFRTLPDGQVTWKYDATLRERWPGTDWARNTGAHPPEVWEKVGCPILLVRGHSINLTVAGKEHVTDQESDRVTQYGKGSSWVKVPGATTHFVQEERPDALVDILKPFVLETARG